MNNLEQEHSLANLKDQINKLDNIHYLFNSLYLQLALKDEEIKELKERVTDLQQYLVPPKFKKGELVKVLGFEDNLFVIDDFVCYDLNHPLYTLYAINDPDHFETISQIDLISTEVK